MPNRMGAIGSSRSMGVLGTIPPKSFAVTPENAVHYPPQHAMRSLFLLSIFLLLSVHAVAAQMKFVEHNFSVEMPAGWSALNPQPADTLLAIQSPNRTQKLLVYATTMSAKSHPDAARELGENAKKGMTKAGYQIGPDQSVTVGGVPRIYGSPPPACTSGGTLRRTYLSGSAGDEVYMLEAISKDKDAASDPQLQAVVQSLRLLSPAGDFHPPPSASRSSKTPFLVAIAVVVVVGALLLLRLLMAKE